MSYYNGLYDDNGSMATWAGYWIDLPFEGCIPTPRVAKYPDNVFGILVRDYIFVARPCRKCKGFKPLDEFYEGHSPCKNCHQLAVRKWQEKNKHKVAKYKAKANAAWRKRVKETETSRDIAIEG